MTIIVLEWVPLVFQCIQRLIFDFPPHSCAPHELINRALSHAQVGHPTEVLDLVPIPLPTLQEVDPQVRMGLIERHVTDKPKSMRETGLGVVPVVIGDAPRWFSPAATCSKQ